MVRNSTPTHVHEFLTIEILLHIKSEQNVIKNFVNGLIVAQKGKKFETE